MKKKKVFMIISSLMMIVLMELWIRTPNINQSLASKDNLMMKEAKHNDNHYEKVSTLHSKTVSTEILVKFDGVLYGQSFAVIDYAGGSEAIGKIDKLVEQEYIPKQNGETNTKEILNALVFSKTNHTIVLQYNNVFVLFEKIME